MSDQKRNATVLGPDCKMTGEIILDNDAIVLGRFEGTLRVSGMLEIGESAEISGTVVAGMLRLSGRCEANVIAVEGAELLPGAELIGQIHTSNLQIVEGAIFQGEVFVSPDAAENAEQNIDQPQARKQRPVRNTAPARAVEQDIDDEYEAEGDVRTVPNVLSNVLQRRRTKVLSSTGRSHRLGDDNEASDAA